MKNQTSPLSAIGDNGTAVDWWFIYKVAGKSTASDGSKATGTEYVYFDSGSTAGVKLTLSPHRINDPHRGPCRAR